MFHRGRIIFVTLLINFSLKNQGLRAFCQVSGVRNECTKGPNYLQQCSNTSISNHKLATNNYIASINPTPGSLHNSKNRTAIPHHSQPIHPAPRAARLAAARACFSPSQAHASCEPVRAAEQILSRGRGEGRTQFLVGKDDS